MSRPQLQEHSRQVCLLVWLWVLASRRLLPAKAAAAELEGVDPLLLYLARYVGSP